MKYLILAIFIVFIFFGGFFQYFKSLIYPTMKAEEKAEQDIKKAEESKIQVVAKGIKRPHGIGFNKGVVYVSSEVDGAIYKVSDGKIEKFVNLDFAHDMIFESDGSIITPDFTKGRVVKISPNGVVKTLYSGLNGPNGIVKDKIGNFYVSNYYSDNVLNLTPDNKKFIISHSHLKGPAGIAYVNADLVPDGAAVHDKIWVTSYEGNTFTSYYLTHPGKLGSELSEFHFSYPDITHPESIFVNSNQKVFATAVRNGKGVVIEVKKQGFPYELVLETDLPDPLVGYFTEDGYVYLVSPNDTEGRILKAKIY